jgi:hypothetical protein
VAYSIRIDALRRVVQVVVSDSFEAADALGMTTAAREAAATSGFHVLYDVRGARAGNLQHTDVFWWPRHIPALTSVKARRVRAAVLHDPELRALAQFWETAYRNVGLQAQAFEDDEAAALAWLGEVSRPSRRSP